MRQRHFEKFVNSMLISALILGGFIWFVVFQNASADLNNSQAKLSFLDAGQADCAILNLPNSVQVLIDTGGDASIVSKVSSRMPAFDKKIEFVMFSHPDSDHIGGFDALAQSYQIGEVIRSGAESESKVWQKVVEDIKNKQIKDVIVKNNESIEISDTAQFDILSPFEPLNASSNNKSIVANLSVGSSRAIFMGDAEVEEQAQILSSYDAQRIIAQIIKISHHGSANGLNQDFLQTVKPEFAIISVGQNSYGHPSSSVLSALANLGIKSYRTDEVGTVDFISDGSSWNKI